MLIKVVYEALLFSCDGTRLSYLFDTRDKAIEFAANKFASGEFDKAEIVQTGKMVGNDGDTFLLPNTDEVSYVN